MVPYVDIIGPCYLSKFYEKSMWCGLNYMWGGCSSISSALLYVTPNYQSVEGIYSWFTFNLN